MDARADPQAPVAFLSWKELLVPIELEAVWGPQLVWTFWGTESFVGPAGNRTPDCPVRILVTTKLFCVHLTKLWRRTTTAALDASGLTPYLS